MLNLNKKMKIKELIISLTFLTSQIAFMGCASEEAPVEDPENDAAVEEDMAEDAADEAADEAGEE